MSKLLAAVAAALLLGSFGLFYAASNPGQPHGIERIPTTSPHPTAPDVARQVAGGDCGTAVLAGEYPWQNRH